MNEPQPFLAYLLIVFLLAVGAALIILAPRIYEFYRRADEKQLARIQNWHPFFKLPIVFRQRLGSRVLIANIRFGGAIVILFAMVLIGLAIRAHL